MLRTSIINVVIFLAYQLFWLLAFYVGGEYVGRPFRGYVSLSWQSYIDIYFPLLTILYAFIAEICIYGIKTANHGRDDSGAEQRRLRGRAASLLPTVTVLIAALLAVLAAGLLAAGQCSIGLDDRRCANFDWRRDLTWLLPVWLAVYCGVTGFTRWAFRRDARTAPARLARQREQPHQRYMAELARVAIDADNGDVRAQVQLGYLYEVGEAVWAGRSWDTGDDSCRPNNLKAMHWYRKAADQGYAPAMYQVGHLYARGWALGRDVEQGRAWMEKAAALGDKDATQWLAEHREPEPPKRGDAG
jgi:hypothetical protein